MAYSRRKAWERACHRWVLDSMPRPHAQAADVSARVGGHRWLEPEALLAAMRVKLQ